MSWMHEVDEAAGCAAWERERTNRQQTRRRHSCMSRRAVTKRKPECSRMLALLARPGLCSHPSSSHASCTRTDLADIGQSPTAARAGHAGRIPTVAPPRRRRTTRSSQRIHTRSRARASRGRNTAAAAAAAVLTASQPSQPFSCSSEQKSARWSLAARGGAHRLVRRPVRCVAEGCHLTDLAAPRERSIQNYEINGLDQTRKMQKLLEYVHVYSSTVYF
jgi:hypothetical protein